MKRTLTVIFALALILTGCKTQFQQLLESSDYDTKYYTAMQYFETGKYTKAAQLFESLSIATIGTERDDTVQFYWGLSNYRAKDFVNAETNFEKFIEHYPKSGFTSDAIFYRLDCMYRETYRWSLDPTPTYKTIAVLSEYLMLHPESEHYAVCTKMLDDLNERLDRKAYEAALLYYKMEDYKAAGVAFHNILKDDPENIYREQILYYTAMSSYKYANNSVEAKKKERFLLFIDDYFNFIGEYPDSDYNDELGKLYEKVSGRNQNI